MSGDDEQAQRADGELTSDEPAIVDEEVWEDVVSASEAEEKSTDNEGQEDEELELALHAPAGPSKGNARGKPARRAVTKADREAAAVVHRASVLCLIGRTLQLDLAASDAFVQALMLSSLRDDLLPFLNPALEEQRSVNCLTPVLKWFRTQYVLFDNNEAEIRDQDRLSIHSQVRTAAECKVGSPEVLTALFTALLRARGFQARVARLLAAAPLAPWKKLPVGSTRAKPKKNVAQRAAAAATAAAAAMADVTRAAAANARGADAGTQPSRKRRAGGSAAGSQSKRSAAAVSGGNGASMSGVAVPDSTTAVYTTVLDVDTDTDTDKEKQDKAKTRKRNKGDDEFEAQLRMAMLATEAEEAARRTATTAATGAAAASTSQAAGPSNKPSLASRTRQKGGGGRAVLSRAAAAFAPSGGDDAAGPPAGAWACWCEVWCGSAEYGRWVHVDVSNGLVDRPMYILESVAREGGLYALSGYVIACNNGSVRDVTSRYLPDSTTVRKLRDAAWWDETVRTLKHMQIGGPAGMPHEPNTNAAAAAAAATAAQSTTAAAGPSGAGAGTSAAGTAAGGPSTTSHASPAKGSKKDSSKGATKAGKAAKSAAADGAAAAAAAAQLRDAREAAELSSKEQAGLDTLPTTIDDFKKHPVYVLKRHITKYQALRPGTGALGLHKGEPYYPRQALSELHTADRWRREGRKVRDDELDKPCKLTKKRKPPAPKPDNGPRGRFGRGPSSGSIFAERTDVPDPLNTTGDGNDTEEPQTKLYGIWQTDPHVLRAQNGLVPKNERGNVEVPPFSASLPIGCVHLRMAALGPICRALEVDYAPALVGFEIQGGRSLPKLEGVVICEEHEAKVTHAYLERESAKQEALRLKRDREMRQAWVQILQAIIVRSKLAEKDKQEGRDVHTHHGSGHKHKGGKRKHRAGDHAGGGAGLSGMQQAVLARLVQENDGGGGGGHAGGTAAGEGAEAGAGQAGDPIAVVVDGGVHQEGFDMEEI